MADRYWVGGTGNLDGSTTTHISATSGGAGGASYPTASDNLYFDANSGGGTVTATGGTDCLTLDFTGFTGTFAGSSVVRPRGSVTLVTGMTWSYTGTLTYQGTSGTAVLTSAGKTFGGGLTIGGAGGSLQHADDFTTTGTITLTDGTYDTNAKTISAALFQSTGTNTRVLTITNSVFSVSNVGNAFNINSATGITVNASGSTIKYTNNSASSKTFPARGLTFGNLWFAGGGAGACIVNAGGTCTLADLKIDNAPRTLTLTAGETVVVSSFTATGSAGNLITVQSSSAGSAATLSIAAGNVVCDYLSVKDITATGGATFYAGSHSTNVSGNSGWLFQDPPFIPVGNRIVRLTYLRR